eukprot:scaffold652_cov68-Phaeocystis_antarctica.AAC.1
MSPCCLATSAAITPLVPSGEVPGRGRLSLSSATSSVVARHSSATAFCVLSVRDHAAIMIRASTLASASRVASVWFETMLWCWLRRWPCWCRWLGSGTLILALGRARLTTSIESSADGTAAATTVWGESGGRLTVLEKL